MEETRISRMYLNIMTRALGRGMEAAISGKWLVSPVTWIVVAVVALVGVGVAIHEKGRGDLTRLKAQVGAAPTQVADVEAIEPGGQAPIVLSREQHPGTIAPEFLSATLLPGRGMNVLQIMAFVPGKGVVPLLASPTLEEAAKAMSGVGEDAGGQASLANGAAFEVPWAGRIVGTPAPGGLSVLTNWGGRSITLPASGGQGAMGGLLLRRGASAVDPSVMPDGGLAEASYEATDFDGHWPSKTEVKTTVVLSARTVDLSMVARNAGATPEPMGIGWRPRFALTGERGQVRLRVPSTMRAEEKEGRPTGLFLPVEHDFSGSEGAALSGAGVDALYTRLKGGALSEGPEVELQNPAAGYTLRMTLLSGSIKALRVTAPAGAGYIGLNPQTNLDDPLGREWKDDTSGMVVLQPGESLQWKVRLELLPLAEAGRR